jgi:hypothetical protein
VTVLGPLAATVLLLFTCSDGPAPSASSGELSSDPLRIARGLFLEAPVSDETLATSVRVLEGLRQRYDLPPGPANDAKAGRRALEEIRRLRFTAGERQRAARRLGISLRPGDCRESCENLERLVLLELQKQALLELAGIRPIE